MSKEEKNKGFMWTTAFVLAPVVWLIRACVLASYWGWFAVNQFSVSPITLKQAFAVSLIWSVFKGVKFDLTDKTQPATDAAIGVIVKIIAYPITWCVGWLIWKLVFV